MRILVRTASKASICNANWRRASNKSMFYAWTVHNESWHTHTYIHAFKCKDTFKAEGVELGAFNDSSSNDAFWLPVVNSIIIARANYLLSGQLEAFSISWQVQFWSGAGNDHLAPWHDHLKLFNNVFKSFMRSLFFQYAVIFSRFRLNVLVNKNKHFLREKKNLWNRLRNKKGI